MRFCGRGRGASQRTDLSGRRRREELGGTHVVLLDDLDEAGVVEVREVAEVVHVGDDVGEVLLEVDKAVLELVVRRVAHAVVGRLGAFRVVVLVVRRGRALALRRVAALRLARERDEVLDLVLVVVDLLRQLGDLRASSRYQCMPTVERLRRTREARVQGLVAISRSCRPRREGHGAPLSPGTWRPSRARSRALQGRQREDQRFIRAAGRRVWMRTHP